jgi:hypothetical protein
VDYGFCYAAFQKLSELLSNYGTAEEVTLAFAATLFLEKVQLFLGLHAFGDHALIQALSYADERAQDGGIVRAGRNVVYKAAVDFQSIQWEFSQITEAGIAHSKIVDG